MLNYINKRAKVRDRWKKNERRFRWAKGRKQEDIGGYVN